MKLPSEKSKPALNINNYIYLVYGNPKSGKSTFCSNFDKTIFICTEPGHKFLEIFKVEPKSWEDIQLITKELVAGQHDFKTVVIDTVDLAYKMCETYTCKKLGVQHPADAPYGKGFAAVREDFVRVVNGLLKADMGVVFISHSQVKDIEENGVKRSYTDSTLSGSAAKVIHGLCDFIFHTYIDAKGNRLMRTKGSPSLNAGDRSGILPEVMPLDYESFKTEIMKWKPTKNDQQTTNKEGEANV